MQKTSDKDVINQLRIEAEVSREFTLSLKAKLRERDALIRMLVQGFMAQEKVRMYEKDGDEVPF